MIKPWLDVHSIAEDERIKVIGEMALSGKLVAVLIDDDVDKIERYIKKLTDRYPAIACVSRAKGPTELVATLSFALKPS